MPSGNVGDAHVNKLLDSYLGDNRSSISPDALFLALYTTEPMNDGSGNELVFANGYSRVEIPNDSDHFPDAVNGIKTNGMTINLPTPTDAGWGAAPWWALMDEFSDLAFYGRLGGVSPALLVAGSTITIPPSTLIIKIRRSYVS